MVFMGLLDVLFLFNMSSYQHRHAKLFETSPKPQQYHCWTGTTVVYIDDFYMTAFSQAEASIILFHAYISYVELQTTTAPHEDLSLPANLVLLWIFAHSVPVATRE